MSRFVFLKSIGESTSRFLAVLWLTIVNLSEYSNHNYKGQGYHDYKKEKQKYKKDSKTKVN